VKNGARNSRTSFSSREIVKDIPIAARVTTIADVFDALTTARVYRAALSREDSLGIMAEEVRKGWWDGRLLDEFRGVLATLAEDDERIRRLSAGPPPR
jgi:putative two-component system response regulator